MLSCRISKSAGERRGGLWLTSERSSGTLSFDSETLLSHIYYTPWESHKVRQSYFITVFYINKLILPTYVRNAILRKSYFRICRSALGSQVLIKRTANWTGIVG